MWEIKTDAKRSLLCKPKAGPRAFRTFASFGIDPPNPPPAQLSANKIKGVCGRIRFRNSTKWGPTTTLKLDLYSVHLGSTHPFPRQCYGPGIVTKHGPISRRKQFRKQPRSHYGRAYGHRRPVLR